VRKLLTSAFIAYAAVVSFLFFAQRSLLYQPDRTDMEAVRVQLPGVERVDLRTADGERIVAWEKAPKPGRMLVIYLHGNGGSLTRRTTRLMSLARDGDGFLAVSWRGYGGSSGSPTEDGLIADAHAAYAHALSRGVPPSRIILFGESLGTGVAIALAASREVAGVALEAPYSSTADVARDIYWYAPVGLLMRDQFRSDLRVGGVRAPILIVHGDNDRVVPIRFGERLYALANQPKEFLRLPGAGHQALDDPRAQARFTSWRDALLER
jgi:hypothetical protein